MSHLAHRQLVPTRRFPPRSHSFECSRDYERPHVRDNDIFGKDFDLPISDVFERSLKGRPSIEIDYAVLGGTPHITGTRIPVFMVLDALEYYGSLDGVLKSYPKLSIDQVKDAVSFAAAVTEHPVDYEVESASR